MPICKCCGVDNHSMLMKEVQFDNSSFEVCGECYHKINLFKEGQEDFKSFTNYLTDNVLLIKLKNYDDTNQQSSNNANKEIKDTVEILSKINDSNDRIVSYNYSTEKLLSSIDSSLKFIVNYIMIVTILSLIAGIICISIYCIGIYNENHKYDNQSINFTFNP